MPVVLDIERWAVVMKRAVRVLMAGCLLGTLAIDPFPSGDVNYTTVEAAPALAFITGTVKDDRGTPLPGAFISLLEPQSNGKEIKSVRTDAQGKFSASILPGLYRIRASAEGFIASFTRVNLDRSTRIKHDFSLRRTDTLVQKRGDSDDYRWIARAARRPAMNLQEEEEEEVIADNTAVSLDDTYVNPRPVFHGFHGMMQLMAVSASTHPGYPQADFYGTNFAVSGSLGGNFEMAFIGQRGAGKLAPQRLAAIATMRPGAKHQVTTTVGYGQVTLARKLFQDLDPAGDPVIESGARPPNAASIDTPLSKAGSLDQLSVSTVGSWQVFQPLLVIYGFDYSRFVGSNRDSVLPRFAVQYAP